MGILYSDSMPVASVLPQLFANSLVLHVVLHLSTVGVGIDGCCAHAHLAFVAWLQDSDQLHVAAAHSSRPDLSTTGLDPGSRTQVS